MQRSRSKYDRSPRFRSTAILAAALSIALSSTAASASQALISAPIGTITEFPVLTGGSGPAGITPGPDGNVWFTEFYANNIGKITPSGSVTEFPVTTAGSQPFGIAAGPDGNLWIIEEDGKVAKVTTMNTARERTSLIASESAMVGASRLGRRSAAYLKSRSLGVSASWSDSVISLSSGSSRSIGASSWSSSPRVSARTP